MSIVALKRKTMNGNPRMAPISGNNNGPLGFALNGTRRITGVVGQINLAPNGNRGLSCCTNDSNIIKRSVMNTKGMLSVRYNNCPGSCQKPIVQETVKTQNEHIKKLHISCHNQTNQVLRSHCGTTDLDETKFACHNKCKNQFIGGKNVFKGAYTKNPPGAVSQSEYINNRYLNKNAFLLAPCAPHFPPSINNNGCNKYYNNAAEYENHTAEYENHD